MDRIVHFRQIRDKQPLFRLGDIAEDYVKSKYLLFNLYFKTWSFHKGQAT